jgi:protein-disulfide isomerase
LKKEYIDNGKIAFYYRHFPLTSIHPYAKSAAIAAECANDQGKFWEYHDLLFQNQNSWVNLPMAQPTQ